VSARHDLIALGASLLSTEQLVSIAVRGLSEDEVRSACRALALFGDARVAALAAHKAGPRLLAMLELGRRACLREVHAATRVRGVADAARLLRPLLDAEGSALAVLALDERMRLARAWCAPSGAASALVRGALRAGAARLIVGRAVAGAAVPASGDVDRALEVARVAHAVEGGLVDWIVLGDDGAASLVRLGVIEGHEARYR
jgi:DNA repair protein RadC